MTLPPFLNPKNAKTKLPNSRCWQCRVVYDGAYAVDANKLAVPDPGDVALCGNCGAINIYDEDLMRAQPTAEQMAEIQANEAWPDVLAAQNAILANRNQ